MKESLELLPIERIAISKNNPRQSINQKSKGFIELTESIKAMGVIEPIHVRLFKNGKFTYELLAGERRMRAAKKAGLQEIRAINHGLITDEEAFEITFAENFAREDLTPIEEGTAVGILLEKYKDDFKAVSAKLGKGEKWVRLRNCIYNQLLPDWKKELAENEDLSYLTAAHFGLIARFPEVMQKGILSRVKKHFGKYTVAELDKDLTGILRLISKAPFDTGKCLECQKRSGVQPTLWTDKKTEMAGKNDRCLDLKCWDKKEADQARKKYLELKEKYPALVCVTTSWTYDGNLERKLKKAYGRVLSPNQYNTSKKVVDGSVPALVVPSSGKGKIIYIETIQKAAQKEVNKPKPLKQLRAELEWNRWSQTIKRMTEQAGKLDYKELKNDKAFRFAVVLLSVVYGSECRIYNKEEIKILKKLNDLFGNNSANAFSDAIELLAEATLGDLCFTMDTGGESDDIKKARIVAGLLNIDIDEIYLTVCNEPGYEEPPAWKNLNADGTPKKTKTGKKIKNKKAK